MLLIMEKRRKKWIFDQRGERNMRAPYDVKSHMKRLLNQLYPDADGTKNERLARNDLGSGYEQKM